MSRMTLIVGSAALGLIAALITAVVVMVNVDRAHVARVRAQATAASLAALNVAAERDSTRNAAAVHRTLAALLADSLKVVEREVVQAEQRGDALDRALEGERRAAYTIYMEADSLHRVVRAVPLTGTAVEGAGERRVSFSVRQAPYTVRANVSIPAPPDTATLALDVKTDAVRIEARVSCSKPDAVGVRRASIDAAAPAWATVRFGRVEQAPEVCAAATPVAPGRRFIEFKRLVVGGGFVRAAKSWSLGGFVGTGLVFGY